ncbi:hypothetical protein [Lentzea sp. NPDC059081]
MRSRNGGHPACDELSWTRRRLLMKALASGAPPHGETDCPCWQPLPPR